MKFLAIAVLLGITSTLAIELATESRIGKATGAAVPIDTAQTTSAKLDTNRPGTPPTKKEIAEYEKKAAEEAKKAAAELAEQERKARAEQARIAAEKAKKDADEAKKAA